jgi:hypothetical protein
MSKEKVAFTFLGILIGSVTITIEPHFDEVTKVFIMGIIFTSLAATLISFYQLTKTK